MSLISVPPGPAPAHARGAEGPGGLAETAATTEGATVAAPSTRPVATTTALPPLTEELRPLPSLSLTS